MKQYSFNTKMEMTRVKIIYILPMLYVGGAEKILFDIIRNIDKDRFEIGLVVLKSDGNYLDGWNEEFVDMGVKVFNLGISGGGFIKFYEILRKFSRLVSYLRDERPDFVHTHLLYADLIGRAAALMARVPRIISTEHNQVGYAGPLKRLLLRPLDRMTSSFVAVSREAKRYLINERGVAEEKISVINNGIETDRFLMPERSYDRKDIMIGAMGKISTQKGFDILIEALAMIDVDYCCEIAGNNDLQEGGLRAKLEARIVELGLQEKVHFVGMQEARGFYSRADIFVISSRWDGLSLVLLEAGASGLPIVATDVGGVRSVIDNGEDGYIVPAGDSKILANKLAELITDRDLREKFGRKLSKMIENNFDISEVAEKHENIYSN